MTNYEVEKFLMYCPTTDEVHIRWKNYTAADDTWESVSTNVPIEFVNTIRNEIAKCQHLHDAHCLTTRIWDIDEIEESPIENFFYVKWTGYSKITLEPIRNISESVLNSYFDEEKKNTFMLGLGLKPKIKFINITK
jgi:hypothetical protein